MKRNIEQLVTQMTLEEKAGLCSGLNFWQTKPIERLGIPSIMMTDGPHGLRKQEGPADHLGLHGSIPSTCFPSAAGLACSWDVSLTHKVGVALGEECQAEDISILLGPGANMKRSPLCGRNFEYFSEDPFLSSEMAAGHIEGVQSQGVGTSLKHFAVNNQEHRRMSVSSEVDERSLREIYLASFEGAVKKAQPWTVMSSYNKVNGVYASENRRLLTDILKEEWGHEGFVVSDWGAVNERVQGLAAGLELEMPSSNGKGDGKIVEAVRNGSLAEEALNRAVERLLTVIFKAVDNNKPNATYSVEEHHRLAREVASESMVLLKNEERILPLKKEGRIAVIGELAKAPRYQGGGSSHVNPTKLDDIAEEIKKSAGGNASIAYVQGYEIASDEINEQLEAEAVRTAQESDIAVLFIGLPDRYESEGYDRTHLRIPANQIHLIEAVTAVNPRVVVVLSNGSPIEMPWLGKVKGLLEAYLGGQALGGAIADLLFGDVSPSGKLAETFPMQLEHNPSHLNFPGEGDRVEYKEGLFIGYRYYDMKKIKPLFPFGFGLSYTSFEYADLTVSNKTLKDTDSVEVTLRVMNTGDVAGKEIVQLYVQDVTSSVIRPDKELKGFVKVELLPGEAKTVTFTLGKRAFAYYNVQIKDWHVETGEFNLMIGKSSEDIILTESVTVDSTIALPKNFTRNSTMGDLLVDPEAASIVQALLKSKPSSEIDENAFSSEMLQAMMNAVPLHALLNFSGADFTEEMLEDMLKKLNAG
ncbi:glycoside hydrolase family 3 C-terminal domain-containing protein [Paenibacillus sinopodophylli]|uniref:glycoside hydrolase family 3 C-terminal domain-containing protein n=1 Tax=Paenibacillus sinopodophylli TaxID=1837342 RepID=UPI00110CD576|nr:glycoside hydrolase family 3 C-terminal domain-containing protein [Paenibacillus sinopodophylli]